MLAYKIFFEAFGNNYDVVGMFVRKFFQYFHCAYYFIAFQKAESYSRIRQDVLYDKNERDILDFAYKPCREGKRKGRGYRKNDILRA